MALVPDGLMDSPPYLQLIIPATQASAAPLLLLHASERRLPDAAPEVAGRLEAGGLSMAFLNNSSSRWESLMEPWRVSVALSDPINPIFKSARTT